MRELSAPIPPRCWQIRCSAKHAKLWSEAAQRHFAAAKAIMAKSPRRLVRAPRIMGEAYRAILDKLVARGFASPRAPVRHSRLNLLLILLRQPGVMARTIHIIGAGLAGLSAALKLSARGESVFVHEAHGVRRRPLPFLPMTQRSA